MTKADPRAFPTIGDNAPLRAEMTFDGMLMTSNSIEPPAPQRAYVMVSRTGTVEAVHSSIARTVRYAKLYAQALAKLGMEPPIAITVGLTGVKGTRFIPHVPEGTVALYDLPSTIVNSDQFHPIETVIETVPKTDSEAATMLRPTLDHIANAFGLSESPSFDSQGNYTRREF